MATGSGKYFVKAWDGGENRISMQLEREDQAVASANHFMERNPPVVPYSAVVEIYELPFRRLIARWNANREKTWTAARTF